MLLLTVRLPAKPVLRSRNSIQEKSTTRVSSSESLDSSYEQITSVDEPYYDMVAVEDEALTHSKWLYSVPHFLLITLGFRDCPNLLSVLNYICGNEVVSAD